jgi:hypothetical protein
VVKQLLWGGLAMVKVVFIVEGECEKILVEYLVEKGWFDQFGLEVLMPVIDVQGGGNLCPHNILPFIEQAKTLDTDKIVILTDLECSPCVTETKSRLGGCDDCRLVVAKKALEAWFLADDALMQNLLKLNTFSVSAPESTPNMPLDYFKMLLKQYDLQGVGPSKPRFTKRLLKMGFDMDRALAHPDVSSLHYFKKTLESLSA